MSYDWQKTSQGSVGRSAADPLHGSVGKRTLTMELPPAPAATPAGARAMSISLGRVRVTAAELNVRHTPTSTASDNIVGELHRNAVVTVVAHEGSWLRIEYHGELAYIHGDYVEPVATPPLAGEPHSEPTSSSGTPHPSPVRPEPPAHVEAKPPAHVDAKPPVHIEAKPPEITPIEPAVDQSIAALGASLPNPTIAQIVADLTVLSTDVATKKRDSDGEYEAKGREKIITDIAAIRNDLRKIEKTGLDATKLGQFLTLVNRKLETLAPYHYQGLNILTIEDATGIAKHFSTCNMTSLAMSLELLGKSAAQYNPAKKQHLLVATKYYRGDLTRKDRGAVKYSGNLSGDWPSLLGLRLPDFLELAAVAEYMNAPTEAEAIRAGSEAAEKKINQDTLERLAHRFGVVMQSHSIDWNKGQDTKLNRVDDLLGGDFGRQRLEVEAMERKRAKAESSGKEADRKEYESAYKKQKVKMHGQNIDTLLPLDRYRQAVASQLGPVVDSGAAVMVGAWSHWIRLYAIDDDHVIVQDPGSWDRHEMRVPWEEARAMGYFWTNLAFR